MLLPSPCFTKRCVLVPATIPAATIKTVIEENQELIEKRLDSEILSVKEISTNPTTLGDEANSDGIRTPTYEPGHEIEILNPTPRLGPLPYLAGVAGVVVLLLITLIAVRICNRLGIVNTARLVVKKPFFPALANEILMGFDQERLILYVWYGAAFSDEGLTLKTSAKPTRAKNIPYQPLLIKTIKGIFNTGPPATVNYCWPKMCWDSYDLMEPKLVVELHTF